MPFGNSSFELVALIRFIIRQASLPVKWSPVFGKANLIRYDLTVLGKLNDAIICFCFHQMRTKLLIRTHTFRVCFKCKCMPYAI